jgi:hypothetical protein
MLPKALSLHRRSQSVRGTVLTVTIDQSVSTATNNSGDRFDASLAEPVRVNGDEVLPAGTKATGTVTPGAVGRTHQGWGRAGSDA